jgi:succinylarginine dihydrolase
MSTILPAETYPTMDVNSVFRRIFDRDSTAIERYTVLTARQSQKRKGGFACLYLRGRLKSSAETNFMPSAAP